MQSERSKWFSDQLWQCHQQLFRYVFTLVRNIEDAQDVLQQTCIVLWEKLDEFESDRSFLAWACGVARFKAREFLRQHRRYRARFSEEFSQRLADIQSRSPPSVIDVRRDALAECIKKLPRQRQDLLHVCYAGNQSIAEVAAGLGRPARGVYNSLRIIRERLLDCIDRALAKEGRG